MLPIIRAFLYKPYFMKDRSDKAQA